MNIFSIHLIAFASISCATSDRAGELPLSDLLSDTASLGTKQNLTTPWNEPGHCSDTKGTTFCVFSSNSFNDGEGITIITTQEVAATLAELPIWSSFESDSQITQLGDTDPRYHDEEIPGKGVGLVSDRIIRRGEMIMNRKPSFLADERIINDVLVVDTLFPEAFANLPSSHQNAYLNLSTHIPVDNPTDKIRGIMLSNSFNIQVRDSHDAVQTFCATFLEGI